MSEIEVVDGQRVRFPAISSRAWEHPADRAAMDALGKLPGFDLLLRKIMGLLSEGPLRMITLGSAIEIGPKQFPRVNGIFEEVLATLDVVERPELFVAQNPTINAGAVGMDRPFIVLNSATVNSMDDGQLRAVLGHEVGHILSEHVLYKTMLRVILRAGTVFMRLPLTGIPLVVLVGALMEWDRKSELSSDRASLLACQDPDVVRSTLLRMAGGVGEGADIGAFREQARRYEEHGGSAGSALKFMALLGRRHPFPVQRLAELDRWVEGGDYERILGGEYPLRTDDAEHSTRSSWRAMAVSYADDVKGSADPVMSWLRGALSRD
jgi:Zn-dependent protease with chaperone function